MLSITRRQLRLALVRSGISLGAVEAAIGYMAPEQQKDEAEIEWADAASFDRLHPTLLLVAAALDLPADQVDTSGLWPLQSEPLSHRRSILSGPRLAALEMFMAYVPQHTHVFQVRFANLDDTPEELEASLETTMPNVLGARVLKNEITSPPQIFSMILSQTEKIISGTA